MNPRADDRSRLLAEGLGRVVDAAGASSSRMAIRQPARLPTIDDQIIGQILDYLALLERWNRTFNLVRADSHELLITRHVLDCAAAACLLAPGLTLDVGSGAGLPGVVLAILDPTRRVVLLDASLKRTRFLGEVQLALKLANVCVLRGRVESLQCPGGRLRPVVRAPWFDVNEAPFDVITARAFAPVARMVSLCRHLLSAETRMQLLKAEMTQVEVADARGLGAHIEIFPYAIPGYPAERCVVEVSTPSR